MKLITYVQHSANHLGAMVDDAVIDLPGTYAAFQEATGETGPAGFPADMLSLLCGDEAIWAAARAAVAWAQSRPGASGQPFIQPLAGVKLAPPLSNPSKIVCVGLNYHDHCREQNVPIPERPLLFTKFPSAIIGPEEAITWNSEVSQQVDYEAELAVIIGCRAKRVSPQKAYDYIAGYTIANDVSARDVQFLDKQWVRAKSFDTFCPLGPYILTADEIEEPHHLTIRCRLNGQVMQDSNTSQMIFKIPELLAYITQTCTLEPGDILITGTPNGVGVFQKPPLFLQPGDVVEVEIEKLGKLRNRVV